MLFWTQENKFPNSSSEHCLVTKPSLWMDDLHQFLWTLYKVGGQNVWNFTLQKYSLRLNFLQWKLFLDSWKLFGFFEFGVSEIL